MYPLRPPQYPPAIPPPPRRPRYFDEVDTATGTSEADAFEVEPLDQIFFNPIITNGINNGEEGEVDILVYQEQERAIYLKGFQASTARSYTYIEDFNPLEDEIQILGLGGRGHVKIMSDENDIPMLTDDIQPAFGM